MVPASRVLSGTIEMFTAINELVSEESTKTSAIQLLGDRTPSWFGE